MDEFTFALTKIHSNRNSNNSMLLQTRSKTDRAALTYLVNDFWDYDFQNSQDRFGIELRKYRSYLSNFENFLIFRSGLGPELGLGFKTRSNFLTEN